MKSKKLICTLLLSLVMLVALGSCVAPDCQEGVITPGKHTATSQEDTPTVHQTDTERENVAGPDFPTEFFVNLDELPEDVTQVYH